MDLQAGKRLGGATGGRNAVDAHVASLAQSGDRVLTSDPDDLRHLLDALAVDAAVVSV